MKKVNLLFLCMIAFISCNEEQEAQRKFLVVKLSFKRIA